MRQCESFLAAADTEERERMAALLSVVSVGAQGRRDDVRRLLKDFRGED